MYRVMKVKPERRAGRDGRIRAEPQATAGPSPKKIDMAHVDFRVRRAEFRIEPGLCL
jgi:hypothetical protein